MIRILGLTVFALTYGMNSAIALSAMTPLCSATESTQTGDAAFARFNQAVANYLSLVQRLHREVPELRVTDKSAEISNRSDMLAGAIQRARAGATQGDFFDAATARLIRERLAAALQREDVASLLKGINDEPILKAPPGVHLRFPVAASLATMPSRLLKALPPLPKELEYRFVGRTLVLRDRDAALILDYVPDALPKP